MAAATEQAVAWLVRETGPANGSSSDGLVRRSQSLARAIESEVIPRLVLARRATRETARPMINGAAPTQADIAELAGIVLTRDADVARSFVERMHSHGAPVETLYLDLLAPTARHLGDLWVEDACHFTDVTVGLCRLQQILHELSPTFRGEMQAEGHGRRVLLAPVPGEQHSFGLAMVGEFFRRAGWDVWDEPEISSRSDLIQLVRSEWFAIIGLSLASDTRIDALSRGIRALRRASRNPALGVLVGGPLFLAHPDLVARVGADATAVDGGQAPVQAENLLGLLGRRS